MRLSFDSSVKQRQLLILQKKEKKTKKKKGSPSVPQHGGIEPSSVGLLPGFIVCHTDQKSV